MSILLIISEYSDEEARSGLYYAGKFIKQAKYSEDYLKNIFDEESRSSPSTAVRAATHTLIQFFVDREGRSASKFTDETVYRILQEITSTEAGISSDLSENELARAAIIAADMFSPS